MLFLLCLEVEGGTRASVGQVSPRLQSRCEGGNAKTLLLFQGRLELLWGLSQGVGVDGSYVDVGSSLIE